MEFSSVVGTVNELTKAQVERQMVGGPLAALTFMQACYPYLARRGGRVINMTSSAGVMGAPGLAAYAMAKEAMRALSRTAAREWGNKGITINCICPIAATDSFSQAKDAEELTAVVETALGRVGSPEEDIAPVALFLASEDSRYLTGYTLMADGGFMIDAAR
jgi:NAD(P)-dependent dehydrogenase (short-subunit alcohol dehydrogenase family)